MMGSIADQPLPLVERLDPSLDAVEVFRRLAHLPHVIFFDSALRHATRGRYSFIAADPVQWLTAPADGSDALALLASRIASLNPQSAIRNPQSPLPPFQGGWAGLLGYELGRSLEPVPAAAIDEFHVPALAIGLYDVVVAFDHVQRTAWLISQGVPETDAASRRERAAARLAQFRDYLIRTPGWHALKGRGEADSNHALRRASGRATPQDDGPLPLSELAPQFPIPGHESLTSNFSADAYRRAVRRAIDYIHAGDVFQVNLSQRLLHPRRTSAVELYLRLRERNPAPFAGYLDGGPWQIASASPERFLRVERGHVETRPIKGTRGRVLRPEADLFAGDELRASEKDRAGNIMIVDLLRNDLSRTCRPETVRVAQLCGLETYQYVQHLVSVVEGRLRNDRTPIDLLRTCFPGGSVTGAPKIRAMQIIAELEPTVRGAYCGSLGYLSLDGRMDTSILIRTITSARGWWQLPVGGGIIAQSNPVDEYEETWHKAAGLLLAIT